MGARVSHQAEPRPRPTSVAGTFYPGNPRQLSAMVEELLEAAAAQPRPTLDVASVIGGMVPHAGLVYSGVIAALTWRLIGEAAPDTIVLAGTDHRAAARGVGVWTGGPWHSPLGEVPVDRDLAVRIGDLGPPFAVDDAAHFGEHSLEVQLPLIARTCPDSCIVPLAVSPRLQDHEPAGRMLGRLLTQLRTAGDRILIVVSSDMAHYPPADVCEEVDDRLLRPLLDLEAEALAALESSFVRARLPGLMCGLCGIDPVRFTLAAVKEMGATRGVLLGKSTSADAGGDPGRTVGYAAAAFTA
jgi:AmmeMemoRadiSam system protein B